MTVSRALDAEKSPSGALHRRGITAAQWVGGVLVVVLILMLPFLANNYIIRVASNIAMFGVLAVAFNFITGFCGYAAFGNVVFFGLGAYATGYVLTNGGPLALAIASAVIVSILVAVVVGWPVLRLRGHYFAIATIGVSEAFREIVTNASPITGGGMGMSLPVVGNPEYMHIVIYFTYAGMLIAALASTAFLVRSRLGYGWNAIRGDEEGAEAVGVDTTRLKILAWSISAAWTGLAGAIYAIWVGYLDPPGAFSLGIALNVAAMTLLGGLGTILGPAVGALVLGTVSELIWGEFLRLHLAVLGIVMIVTVIFIPRGLMHLFGEARMRAFRTSRK